MTKYTILVAVYIAVVLFLIGEYLDRQNYRKRQMCAQYFMFKCMKTRNIGQNQKKLHLRHS